MSNVLHRDCDKKAEKSKNKNWQRDLEERDGNNSLKNDREGNNSRGKERR